MKTTFKPGDASLGALSEVEIKQTFDLYQKIFLPHSFGGPLQSRGCHSAPKNDENLKYLSYTHQSTQPRELEYEFSRWFSWRPKRFEMGDDNGPASWAVTLTYAQVHRVEDSDIEAMIRTHKSNGRYKGEVKRNFKISEIELNDYVDNSNQFEIDFSRVRQRLIEIDNTKKLSSHSSELETSNVDQSRRGSWADSMILKGYEEGPLLSDFDELLKWEQRNIRAHIRSWTSDGYQVFFVDRSENPPSTKY